MSSKDLENSESVKQSVSERLLMLLKTRGELQASDAGKILGTTGEAMRQQFVKLAKEGLVENKAITQGVGRPAQYWVLTAAGHARFPDTHADLTVQLLRMIRSSLGEDALNQLISTREAETLKIISRRCRVRIRLRKNSADWQRSARAKAIWQDGKNSGTTAIC